MRTRVTIATITANRRRFFVHAIRNVRQQLASDFDIEWVIVEDGEETVEDLVDDVEFARYIRIAGANNVGFKRNIANEVSRGDYIIYFDDDNYAFPHRVSVSVNSLARSDLLMAGSSDMLVFDRRNWEIFQVGPFSEMHATLGTWCIKRELLARTSFWDDDQRGEELSFTGNWSIPILQLGALNTSISFSHSQNTVPKHELKEPWAPVWPPETFINCSDTLQFYRSIN